MLKGIRSAVYTTSRTWARRPLVSAVRGLQTPAKHTLYALESSALRASPLRSPCSSSVRFLANTSSSRVVDEPAREVEYKDVKALVDHPNPDTVLVDVREPAEFEEGHIPNAINIPFKSMPGALGLDSAEFESTLGFPKPDPSKTLLFYCLGGVRSTGSEQLASTYGYRNRLNYKGSYGDWQKHQTASESQ